MLMLIYTLLAMAVTPIAYEFVNRKVMNVTGWPSYAINLIVCGVVALIAMFLPGGWKVDLWNWIVLTALIYFGNQFVFNSIVKPLLRKESV
jgi:hypothetical protein